MKTRCKFRCESITRNAYYGTIKLVAVHDSKINTEDHAFNTATPSGTLEMTVCPVAKADFFTPDKYYYLDISEVPAVVPAE